MSGEIDRRIDQIVKNVIDERKLARIGYDFFRKSTPIKSGRARKSTVLRDSDIRADYPYAGRLDQGYSKQAPDGMSNPTVKHIQEYIQRELRK